MKINKQNPKHWLYLAKNGTYSMVSVVVRPFWFKRGRPIVTFYGHKFNGNLKAIADYANTQGDFEVCYATLDPEYYKELVKAGSDATVLNLQKFKDVLKASKSKAIISDRHAMPLIYFLYFTRIPFIDVWHGIQMFKRFVPKDMELLKKYREVWTSSPELARIYRKDYGFDGSMVKATGYARVDGLVNNTYSLAAIRSKYGIDKKYKKIILLAPTWQQDDPSRQIIPFNEDPKVFLKKLNDVAARLNALVIFRAHLNTNSQNHANLRELKNIKIMSHEAFPQAEEFLAISDLLVGDWSSIAYDYLPLHRPTIFLDVPMPFAHGLTFDKSYRFGEVVDSLDKLLVSIEKYIQHPDEFIKKYSRSMKRAEEAAYGPTLDGKSAERCYKRLKQIAGA